MQWYKHEAKVGRAQTPLVPFSHMEQHTDQTEVDQCRCGVVPLWREPRNKSRIVLSTLWSQWGQGGRAGSGKNFKSAWVEVPSEFLPLLPIRRPLKGCLEDLCPRLRKRDLEIKTLGLGMHICEEHDWPEGPKSLTSALPKDCFGVWCGMGSFPQEACQIKPL